MGKINKTLLIYVFGAIAGIIAQYILFSLLMLDGLGWEIIFYFFAPIFALFGLALARTLVLWKLNKFLILTLILIFGSVALILITFLSDREDAQSNILIVNNFIKEFEAECNSKGYMSNYETTYKRQYHAKNMTIKFECEQSNSEECEKLNIDYSLILRQQNAPGTGGIRAAEIPDYVMYKAVVDCKQN